MVWSGLQVTLPPISLNSTQLHVWVLFPFWFSFIMTTTTASNNGITWGIFFFKTIGKEEFDFSGPSDKSPELWADWAILEPVPVDRKIPGCWLAYACYLLGVAVGLRLGPQPPLLGESWHGDWEGNSRIVSICYNPFSATDSWSITDFYTISDTSSVKRNRFPL